jgi:hypothetical protein
MCLVGGVAAGAAVALVRGEGRMRRGGRGCAAERTPPGRGEAGRGRRGGRGWAGRARRG